MICTFGRRVRTLGSVRARLAGFELQHELAAVYPIVVVYYEQFFSGSGAVGDGI